MVQCLGVLFPSSQLQKFILVWFYFMFTCTYSYTAMALGKTNWAGPIPYWIKIRIGDQPLFKNSDSVLEVNIAILDEIVKQMDIPGLTHVDLFNYIIVAGSMHSNLVFQSYLTLDRFGGSTAR